MVETYDEVSEFLNRWEHDSPSAQEAGLYTGDFATMYTSIPHEELFKAIETTTREAFDWAADKLDIAREQICIQQLGSGRCRWVKSLQRNGTLSHDLFMKHVRFLVSNTYLQAGDSLYRQKVGIPMGTNCAPGLANLFLFYYESAFISRLITERGVLAARHFRTSFRLIDDLLSVGNPELESALSVPFEEGGLYPRAMQLGKTSASTTEAEFIGIHITQKGTRFHLSVYDKRKSFPFTVRRYPRMNSLIPRTIPYGVFTGLLWRGFRINSGVNGFVSYALEIAQILRANGCTTKKLKRTFKAFIWSANKKYSATNTEVINRFCSKLGSKG